MEVRSYYASTLEAAIAMARRELGPEALLIQSQRTSPEWAHLGKYEAVFAGEIVPVPVKPPRLPENTSSLASPVNLKGAPADLVGRPDFRALFQAAGRTVPPNARRTPASVSDPDIPCDPGLGSKGSAATVALIGSSGAGKTVTAMKLALRYGALENRSVRLLAYDPYRVGATRSLRHFADLLGMLFYDCESIAQLQTAIAEGDADLTLIDTPGFSAKHAAEREQLSVFLRSLPQIETQLVLRLDRKPADNLDAVARFASFAPKRVILTCLDETSDLTDLPALITRTNASVSFLGTGQLLIEDLEAAASPRLSELVLNGWAKSACAAA